MDTGSGDWRILPPVATARNPDETCPFSISRGSKFLHLPAPQGRGVHPRKFPALPTWASPAFPLWGHLVQSMASYHALGPGSSSLSPTPPPPNAAGKCAQPRTRHRTPRSARAARPRVYSRSRCGPRFPGGTPFPHGHRRPGPGALCALPGPGIAPGHVVATLASCVPPGPGDQGSHLARAAPADFLPLGARFPGKPLRPPPATPEGPGNA